MNRLTFEDRERFRKLSQVKTSAFYFADAAETAFSERLGHLAEGGAPGAFPAVGSVFSMAAALLAELERSFSQVLLDQAMAWACRRLACRRRKTAYKAARREVCAIRRFADCQTGGEAHLHLGVRGPTPRHPEQLAAWGEILCDRLPQADLPEEARPLAAAMAEKLAPLVRELNDAIEQAEDAWTDERLAGAEVTRVRKEVDAELDKTVEFLTSSLKFAGQDYLASRVLGKRRGRPPKSAKRKSAAAPAEAETASRKSDSAPDLTAQAGREFDSAPQPDVRAGRKIDSAPQARVPGAYEELQEIEEAQNRASKALEEIVERPSEACTALEKIAEGPCKPCTEPSQDVEVASFQKDTSRSTRWRRRRVASALLGASARLLPSGWMRRFAGGERGQGRRADRV